MRQAHVSIAQPPDAAGRASCAQVADKTRDATADKAPPAMQNLSVGLRPLFGSFGVDRPLMGGAAPPPPPPPNHPATGFAKLFRWQKKRIVTIMTLDWHITIITNQLAQNY